MLITELPLDVLLVICKVVYRSSPSSFDVLRFVCRRIRRVADLVKRPMTKNFRAFWRNIAREGRIEYARWAEMHIFQGEWPSGYCPSIFASGPFADRLVEFQVFVLTSRAPLSSITRHLIRGGKSRALRWVAESYPGRWAVVRDVNGAIKRHDVDTVRVCIEYGLAPENPVQYALKHGDAAILQLFHFSYFRNSDFGRANCAGISHLLRLGLTPNYQHTLIAVANLNWAEAMMLYDYEPCEPFAIKRALQLQINEYPLTFPREVTPLIHEKVPLDAEMRYFLALLTDEPSEDIFNVFPKETLINDIINCDAGQIASMVIHSGKITAEELTASTRRQLGDRIARVVA